MKTYKEHDLRDLYNASNEYWNCYDIDMPKMRHVRKVHKFVIAIDREYWLNVMDIASFVSQTKSTYSVLVDALRCLGYEPDKAGGDKDGKTETV